MCDGMSPLISLESVTVKNGQKHLLYQVNWQVMKGEHWLIFGMNGSGKTTLLSLIAGYKTPTSGIVKIQGNVYDSENLFSLRKKIGWVSSSFFDRYFHNESVLYIVLSGLNGTLGITSNITAQQVRFAKHLLCLFQIENKKDMPYTVLSKGERQAVLIARALIAEPELLILDEPSSGLDLYAQNLLRQIVSYLVQRTEITVLYVTHRPDEILPFLQHTLLLRNGRVYEKGITEQLMTSDILTQMLGCSVQVTTQRNDTKTIKMNLHLTEQITSIWK